MFVTLRIDSQLCNWKTVFHWTPSNSIGYEIKHKTFRPKIGSPVCKVELKGPAAGGAAAPFRYILPNLVFYQIRRAFAQGVSDHRLLKIESKSNRKE